MEKVVNYVRSQGLKKQLESLRVNGGWLTTKSLEQYLLYGILPILQRYSAFCFSSQLQDDVTLENGTHRITLPAELADSIGPLSDQYSLTQTAFVRLALWLALEVYMATSHEKIRPSKEEFRRFAEEIMLERLRNKTQ